MAKIGRPRIRGPRMRSGHCGLRASALGRPRERGRPCGPPCPWREDASFGNGRTTAKEIPPIFRGSKSHRIRIRKIPFKPRPPVAEKAWLILGPHRSVPRRAASQGLKKRRSPTDRCCVGSPSDSEDFLRNGKKGLCERWQGRRLDRDPRKEDVSCVSITTSTRSTSRTR